MKQDLSDRIAKVKGIMEGIQKMLEKDRPMSEVAQQIRAAYGALRRAELAIIESEIRECIEQKGKGIDGLIDRIFKFVR